MMNAEYPENRRCPQKDSAEHEEYAGAQSVGGQEVVEQDGADLLERMEYLKRYEKESSENFRISIFTDGAEIAEGYKSSDDIILTAKSLQCQKQGISLT